MLFATLDYRILPFDFFEAPRRRHRRGCICMYVLSFHNSLVIKRDTCSEARDPCQVSLVLLKTKLRNWTWDPGGSWDLFHCFGLASFRFGLRGTWGICFTMISVNIWGPNCSHTAHNELKLGLEPRGICRLIFVQIHFIISMLPSAVLVSLPVMRPKESPSC